MSKPLTFSSILTRPSTTGQPAVDIPVPIAALAETYDTKSEDEVPLVGAGTYNVDAAMFTALVGIGAKFITIEVQADTSPAADPVMVQVNSGGAGGQFEIAPGGFLIYSNPDPTADGVLSLELVHTADATVIIRVFG